MAFIETNTITAALVTAVAAITHDFGDGNGAVPLFELVVKYDAPDLLDAAADTLKYKDRVCLVVPGTEDYEDKGDGESNIAVLERISDFSLVITDNDFADGQESYFGTGGVVAMKDLVVNALKGNGLGIPGVSMLIERGGPLDQREEGGNRKRKGWIARFYTSAGFENLMRRNF